jgi:hypothetical protein
MLHRFDIPPNESWSPFVPTTPHIVTLAAMLQENFSTNLDPFISPFNILIDTTKKNHFTKLHHNFILICINDSSKKSNLFEQLSLNDKLYNTLKLFLTALVADLSDSMGC